MKVPETYAAQSVSQKMSGSTEENRLNGSETFPLFGTPNVSEPFGALPLSGKSLLRSIGRMSDNKTPDPEPGQTPGGY
jgi:hypothetical protein